MEEIAAPLLGSCDADKPAEHERDVHEDQIGAHLPESTPEGRLLIGLSDDEQQIIHSLARKCGSTIGLTLFCTTMGAVLNYIRQIKVKVPIVKCAVGSGNEDWVSCQNAFKCLPKVEIPVIYNVFTFGSIFLVLFLPAAIYRKTASVNKIMNEFMSRGVIFSGLPWKISLASIPLGSLMILTLLLAVTEGFWVTKLFGRGILDQAKDCKDMHLRHSELFDYNNAILSILTCIPVVWKVIQLLYLRAPYRFSIYHLLVKLPTELGLTDMHDLNIINKLCVAPLKEASRGGEIRTLLKKEAIDDLSQKIIEKHAKDEQSYEVKTFSSSNSFMNAALGGSSTKENTLQRIGVVIPVVLAFYSVTQFLPSKARPLQCSFSDSRNITLVPKEMSWDNCFHLYPCASPGFLFDVPTGYRVERILLMVLAALLQIWLVIMYASGITKRMMARTLLKHNLLILRAAAFSKRVVLCCSLALLLGLALFLLLFLASRKDHTIRCENNNVEVRAILEDDTTQIHQALLLVLIANLGTIGVLLEKHFSDPFYDIEMSHFFPQLTEENVRYRFPPIQLMAVPPQWVDCALEEYIRTEFKTRCRVLDFVCCKMIGIRGRFIWKSDRKRATCYILEKIQKLQNQESDSQSLMTRFHIHPLRIGCCKYPSYCNFCSANIWDESAFGRVWKCRECECNILLCQKCVLSDQTL